MRARGKLKATEITELFLPIKTVSVNLPSIPANSRASVTVALAGVIEGQMVLANPPKTFTDGLVFGGACVSGNNQLTLFITNTTGGAIDAPAQNWFFTIIKPIV